MNWYNTLNKLIALLMATIILEQDAIIAVLTIYISASPRHCEVLLSTKIDESCKCFEEHFFDFLLD